MYIYRDISSLKKYLDGLRNENKTIGFAPTMGALHEGHISLVERMNMVCDYSIVSIFVNPTQFNDPGDLSKYPKPIEDDIKKLYDIQCDVVFIPSVNEIYPDGEEVEPQLDFDGLDELWKESFARVILVA